MHSCERIWIYLQDCTRMNFWQNLKLKQHKYSQKVQPQYHGCWWTVFCPCWLRRSWPTINQRSFSVSLSALSGTCFSLSHCSLIHGRCMWISMSFFRVRSHSHFAICSQFIRDKQSSKMHNLRLQWKWNIHHKWFKRKQNISWTQSHDINYHAQIQQQAQKHEL
jgi:hypothetical protein